MDPDRDVDQIGTEFNGFLRAKRSLNSVPVWFIPVWLVIQQPFPNRNYLNIDSIAINNSLFAISNENTFGVGDKII